MNTYEKITDMLNKSLHLNIFTIYKERIRHKSENKDSICSHCPKQLFSYCFNNWSVGYKISQRYQAPYYYFCPLNLTLAILPISYPSFDFICIGPILLKDIESHRMNLPSSLRALASTMYIPHQMHCLTWDEFTNFVTISFLSYKGGKTIPLINKKKSTLIKKLNQNSYNQMIIL